MLLVAGVDISRLERNTRRSLNYVEKVLDRTKNELVITSTYGGVHSASSLHYAHRAYDLRLPKDSVSVIQHLIKRALGNDYDVVVEDDHFHIEYDPDWEKER